jgi:hypothetical protein
MLGTSWQDWVFTAAAGVLAVAGVVLLSWSLWWDRPRGRKRCPKCWYDMSGAAGLVCPECGKDARRERRLLKTRRRWGWGVLAMVLLLAAYPVRQVPVVRRDGWWAAAPTWVLILKVPDVEEPRLGIPQVKAKDALTPRIEERLFVSHWKLAPMWLWERAILERAAVRAMRRGDGAPRRMGARILASLHPDAAQRVAETDRGIVALYASAAAHSEATSYVGVAVSEGDGELAESVLAFQRGIGYRWELKAQTTTWGARHMIVWSNEDGTRCWDTRGDAKTESQASNAINRMTAVTHVLPGEPVALLLGEPGGLRYPILELVAPTWVGAELIDGVLCDHVSGVGWENRVAVDVWVERQTRCLKRIRHSFELRTGTTTFRGQFNVPIDETLLQFDPTRAEDTPLFRGELQFPSTSAVR